MLRLRLECRRQLHLPTKNNKVQRWLTCRLNVSSGLNASNRACSWPLLGVRRKNSLQKPSEGSKSSVVYCPVSTWHRANEQETYFEKDLVELDDLRLKGLRSTLLGEGRGLHGARRRVIGCRSPCDTILLQWSMAGESSNGSWASSTSDCDQLGTSHFVSGSSHMSFAGQSLLRFPWRRGVTYT